MSLVQAAPSLPLDPGTFLTVAPAVAILLALIWLLGSLTWQVTNGGSTDAAGIPQPREMQVAAVRRVWVIASIVIVALLILATAMYATATLI